MEEKVLSNIITVDFSDHYYTKQVNGLLQWDYGQVLQITGLTPNGNIEVHFSLTERGGEAYRAIAETVNTALEVTIPAFILQNNSKTDYKAYAFIYDANETEGKTVRKIVLPITARPVPAEWSLQENPDELQKLIGMINKKTNGKVLWKGYFASGTLELQIPMDCLHANNENLTLLIEAYPLYNTVGGHVNNEGFSMVNVCLNRYAFMLDDYSTIYPTLYADLYSGSANSGVGMRVGAKISEDMEYVDCIIELMGALSNTRINCISAFIPCEEVA